MNVDGFSTTYLAAIIGLFQHQKSVLFHQIVVYITFPRHSNYLPSVPVTSRELIRSSLGKLSKSEAKK